MKNLFPILLLSLCVGFASCNEEYDADTAVSHYQPVPGKRLVASVKTTFVENGGEATHYHRYTYDANGRIKSVNSELVVYSGKIENFIDTVYYKCNMTTSANYFYRGEELEVAYTVSIDYPDRPVYNKFSSSSNYGIFKSNGVLSRFSQSSFDYSTTMLLQSYADDDICFSVFRDSAGNVTGYKKFYASTGEVLEDKRNICTYDTSFRNKNKTNFDFSAYFGYWGVEQGVPIISTPYRAPYQLAAFGMLGSTSQHLPKGGWKFDEQECPVSYTDPSGRHTVITYHD